MLNKKLRRFGIELEVTTRLSRTEVVNALVESADVKVQEAGNYSATSDSEWSVKYDGSINGWEIVSPPTTETSELKEVCRVLRKELKAKGSPKCGMHIHIDISDLNINQIKNIYNLYFKYEKNAIKSIMRKHRAHNSYCQSITREELIRINQLESLSEFNKFSRHSSRYKTLNAQAFVKFGTLEFRHHHGTTDINEVLTWLEITQKIVETATKTKDLLKLENLKATTFEESLEEMLEEIGVEEVNKLARNRRKAIEKADKRRSLLQNFDRQDVEALFA